MGSQFLVAPGHPPMRIAVNVSPLQLRDEGFIAEVREVIGESAAAAGALELEITESMIMNDMPRTSRWKSSRSGFWRGRS